MKFGVEELTERSTPNFTPVGARMGTRASKIVQNVGI